MVKGKGLLEEEEISPLDFYCELNTCHGFKTTMMSKVGHYRFMMADLERINTLAVNMIDLRVMTHKLTQQAFHLIGFEVPIWGGGEGLDARGLLSSKDILFNSYS